MSTVKVTWDLHISKKAQRMMNQGQLYLARNRGGNKRESVVMLAYGGDGNQVIHFPLSGAVHLETLQLFHASWELIRLLNSKESVRIFGEGQ